MRETSDKENLVKSYNDLANSILPDNLPYITHDEAKKQQDYWLKSLVIRKMLLHQDMETIQLILL